MDRVFTYEDIIEVYPIAAIIFKNRYPKGTTIKKLKPMDKWMAKILSELKPKE